MKFVFSNDNVDIEKDMFSKNSLKVEVIYKL